MLIFNVVLFIALSHAAEMIKPYRCKAETCAKGVFGAEHSVTGGHTLVALQSPVLTFNYHNLI